MDPIYEINSQFAHYVCVTRYTYAINADKLALVKLN